jgi:2-phospho-L-lactate/phosphoenolpyruvate guanylyltransferase
VHGSLGADLSSTWALVPIRGLETAKSRLGGDLDAEERLELVTELLRRTLVATRDARHVAGTIVVTMDGDAAELARRHDAIGLVERAPGLNEAIEAARSVAMARGATAVLVLPADLPAVSSEAVDALVLAAATSDGGPGPAARPGVSAGVGRRHGLVALVGDRHGSGTNALLLAPPDVIAPSFGGASRAAHARAAAAAGARFVELESPLALDVDTSDDLLAAEAALGSLRG